MTSLDKKPGAKAPFGTNATFTLGDEYELVAKRRLTAVPFSVEQASALRDTIGNVEVDLPAA